MCRAWGVWSLRSRSLRSGCRWPHWSCRALLEQRILSSASRRPCGSLSLYSLRLASLALFAREGRRCPFADKTMGRRSSERPYHRPQARRLQRDVQLTGPLAVGEPWGCAALDQMVVKEADAGAAMAAAAGRARPSSPGRLSYIDVHDDDSWPGSTSDSKASSAVGTAGLHLRHRCSRAGTESFPALWSWQLPSPGLRVVIVVMPTLPVPTLRHSASATIW